MNGKGRPEKLTDDLKRWIVLHQQGRKKKLKATAIRADMRDFIEAELRQEIKDLDPPWTEELIQEEIDNLLPGLSIIQKFLKPTNEKLDTPSVLDNPWHLGTIRGNPLPAEAIPYILAVQKWTKDKNVQPLTIRQAFWISQLYSLWGKLPLKEKELRSLWAGAGGYAWYEQISEMSGIIHPDTTILDEALEGLRPWQDAMFTLILPEQLKYGTVSPTMLAWLLQKTKSKDKEVRESAEKIINTIVPNREKDGEK
jgi:hypothetical protein